MDDPIREALGHTLGVDGCSPARCVEGCLRATYAGLLASHAREVREAKAEGAVHLAGELFDFARTHVVAHDEPLPHSSLVGFVEGFVADMRAAAHRSGETT